MDRELILTYIQELYGKEIKNLFIKSDYGRNIGAFNFSNIILFSQVSAIHAAANSEFTDQFSDIADKNQILSVKYFIEDLKEFINVINERYFLALNEKDSFIKKTYKDNTIAILKVYCNKKGYSISRDNVLNLYKEASSIWNNNFKSYLEKINNESVSDFDSKMQNIEKIAEVVFSESF